MTFEKPTRRSPMPLRLIASLLVVLLTLAACGGGDEAAPTATPVPRAPVPTFTPTPPGQPTADPLAGLVTGDAAPEAGAPAEAATPADPEPAPTEDATEEAPAEPTATPAPQVASLTVTTDNVNVRRGPSTAFGIVGQANIGMNFEILGRNQAGDWFNFCCVNGEEGWIFADLVTVENGDLVAVAQNIPAPPAPTATPVPPPTNTPAPAAPPPAANPCAGIGGDGCKFRVTGGPTSAPNGGGELKLQFLFIHSGVDGGQPQGSYFVALEKDGQRLPIADSVRSIALNANQGALGRYNYEFKLGRDRLPGNNVAGNYTGWVLDGNGERDSQNFSFSLGEGQGEVWIQFDQG
jgi:hypothetical protein